MASIEIIKSIDWNNSLSVRTIPVTPQGTEESQQLQSGALSMSGIGQRFPEFASIGVVSSDMERAFQSFTHDSFPGKWKVVFFWPKDFTFVCPTEIAAFGKLDKEFKARDAQVL